jgi:hypothetical protein
MTTLSTPPTAPLRSNPTNFAAQAETFLAWMSGTLPTELNLIVGEINTDAGAVSADKTTTEGYKDLAYDYQLLARGFSNFQGTYGAGTAYVIGDCVESSGTRYVCKSPTTGNAPPNATYWIVVSGTGTVTSVAAGTGMSFTSITGTGSVAIDKATAANIWASASNKVITADLLNAANAQVSLGTLTSSLTIDLTTGRVFTGTLGTVNLTLADPTTEVAGMSGLIVLVQHASSAKTLSIGSQWFWVGGTPSPTISATLSSKNVYSYYVRAAGEIMLTYLGAYS